MTHHFQPRRLNSTIVCMLVALPLRAALAAPDLSGVWQVASPVTELTTIDGQRPPLSAAAQKLYDGRQQLRSRGDLTFDGTIRCRPMGEPRTAYDPNGGPFEILQADSEIVFSYTWNRMVRFIYLTDAVPDVLGPTYYGTATAHWRGTSLVVSAIGFHDTTLLDASGLPHSSALQLTETFQLTNAGQQLQETIRFVDANTFTRPWEARVVYKKLPRTRIEEDVCIERLNIKDY